jgi:hypothetical protein
MVMQIRAMIEEINAIPLRVDTISFDPPCSPVQFTFFEDFTDYAHTFYGIFFDKQERLRKYHSSWRGDSQGYRTTAYYDEDGNLIFISTKSFSSVEGDEEYYYVHNGYIVNFRGDLEWYWGEMSEEEIKEEVNRIRPVIGSPLTTTIGGHHHIAHFLNANTLLREIIWEE